MASGVVGADTKRDIFVTLAESMEGDQATEEGTVEVVACVEV